MVSIKDIIGTFVLVVLVLGFVITVVMTANADEVSVSSVGDKILCQGEFISTPVVRMEDGEYIVNIQTEDQYIVSNDVVGTTVEVVKRFATASGAADFLRESALNSSFLDECSVALALSPPPASAMPMPPKPAPHRR